MYYTYIIKSDNSDAFYTGISDNPLRRLLEHNRGQVETTKSKRPWSVVYTEAFTSRSRARVREKFLKSGAGREERAKLLLNHRLN